MTDPRTEAGRRLMGWLWSEDEHGKIRDAVLAIEAEAAAGLDVERLANALLEVFGDPGDNYDIGAARVDAAVLLERLGAAAGPRDEAVELCPECGGQYSDLPGHRRLAHNVPEAAAGPRDEGLDVERLAHAIAKHHRRSYIDMVDTLAAKDIARKYAVLAKASE